MTSKDAESALEYLIGEHLLDEPSPYSVKISHLGKTEIEASIKYPDKDTQHFSHNAINIFFGDVAMVNHITNDLRGANVANFANQLSDRAKLIT